MGLGLVLPPQRRPASKQVYLRFPQGVQCR